MFADFSLAHCSQLLIKLEPNVPVIQLPLSGRITESCKEQGLGLRLIMLAAFVISLFTLLV
jgi:hypothetical protein